MNIEPLKVPQDDIEDLLKFFSAQKDNTRFMYKKFMDIFSIIDVVKPKKNMISFFSVAYAILQGIMKNYQEIPNQLAELISDSIVTIQHLGSFKQYL